MPAYERMADDGASSSDLPLSSATVLQPRKTRTVFVIFNTIYLIGGFGCLVSGAWALGGFQTEAVDSASAWITPHGVLRNNSLMLCAQMLTAAGVISLAVSVIGFVFARKRHGLAITFTILLGTTMFFQWMTAYAAYDTDIALSRLQNEMLEFEYSTLGNETDTQNYHDTKVFIQIQKRWQCCGVANSSEWVTQVDWFHQKYGTFSKEHSPNRTVLEGCCDDNDSRCQNCLGDGQSQCKTAPPEAIYSSGCSRIIYDYLHRLLSTVCIVAAVCGILQLLGLFVSIHLSTSFHKVSPENC